MIIKQIDRNGRVSGEGLGLKMVYVTLYGYKRQYYSLHGRIPNMGFVIFLSVVMLVVSIIIAICQQKAREEEKRRIAAERESQRSEWKEFNDKIKAQNKEIKKTVRESQKAMENNMVIKIVAKMKAQSKAYEQAENEFKENKIENISRDNSELKKRAKEIYDSGVYSDYEEEEYQKEIRMDRETSTKPLPGKTYGGYAFSLAQMETVVGLQEQQKEKIGQIMVAAKKARKKKYQIKQDLFAAIPNWDTEFFVELKSAKSFFEEKSLIASFYHEFEFESKEEAEKIINQSEYLKHYPELKEEILKDVLWVLSL